ncbi:MAG: Holliday junction resolvase RuvX [Geodermatophilaceae bacterium]|nr:Holliday junction resolvase RuvX [Geodermatophilaceae bacterium]MDQ3476747.1 Holliday junction resolvase RuvX [Actinomycetota bacterium]
MSADTPRAGRRLGIDVGSVRVGVALSDPYAILATPLATLARDRGAADQRRIADLVHEHEVVEVVVGLPLHLSGAQSAASKEASAYSVAVATLIEPVPVRLVDERLSTRAASAALAAQGLDSRAQRGLVDQTAAAIILQTWLDHLAHRRQESP